MPLCYDAGTAWPKVVMLIDDDRACRLYTIGAECVHVRGLQLACRLRCVVAWSAGTSNCNLIAAADQSLPQRQVHIKTSIDAWLMTTVKLVMCQDKAGRFEAARPKPLKVISCIENSNCRELANRRARLIGRPEVWEPMWIRLE